MIVLWFGPGQELLCSRRKTRSLVCGDVKGGGPISCRASAHVPPIIGSPAGFGARLAGTSNSL